VARSTAADLRRLICEIRRHWPRVEILLCGDSHYYAPEVLDLCSDRGVDFMLGLASNANLRRRTAPPAQLGTQVKSLTHRPAGAERSEAGMAPGQETRERPVGGSPCRADTTPSCR
jgi:hypothetical protein